MDVDITLRKTVSIGCKKGVSKLGCMGELRNLLSDDAIIIFFTPSLHAASITLYVEIVLVRNVSLSGTIMTREYAAK